MQNLRLAVKTAQVRQDALLDAVIALPPEGAGSDYADSMADTLAMYTRQVTTISTALSDLHPEPGRDDGPDQRTHPGEGDPGEGQPCLRRRRAGGALAA